MTVEDLRLLAVFEKRGVVRGRAALDEGRGGRAGSGLSAAACADLALLEPVLALGAWSRGNDRVDFDALLERVRAERAHEEEEHGREQRAFADRRAESAAAGRERLERMLADRAPGMTRAGTREIALPKPPPWAQPPVGRRPRREETAPATTEAPAPIEAALEEGTAAGPGEAGPVAAAAERPARPRLPAESGDGADGRGPRPDRPRGDGRPPVHGERRPAGPPRVVDAVDGARRHVTSPCPTRSGSLPARTVGGLTAGKLVRFARVGCAPRGHAVRDRPRGEARVMLGLFTTRCLRSTWSRYGVGERASS